MKNILNNKTQPLQPKKLDWNEIRLEMKEKFGNDIVNRAMSVTFCYNQKISYQWTDTKTVL